MQEEISYLPRKDEYVVSSSEFERVKARLIEIDQLGIAAGDSQGQAEAKRPTLKRRTNTDGTEREEPTLKKDRPTLKRAEGSTS